MSFYEINITGTWIAGLVGAVAASWNHGWFWIAVSAVGGIAISIAVFFGLVGVGLLLMAVDHLLGKAVRCVVSPNDTTTDSSRICTDTIVTLPYLPPVLSGIVAFSVFQLL